MNPNGRQLYHVTLGAEERSSLEDLVEGGRGSQERRKRAHILLLADMNRNGGGLWDADIAPVLHVVPVTVERGASNVCWRVLRQRCNARCRRIVRDVVWMETVRRH